MSRRFVIPLLWLPAVLVLVPVVVVAWRALPPPGEVWEQVVEHRLASHVRQTVILVVTVPALAVALGVPAAWQVTVHRFPGRGVFEWALLLPLAMPGFVAALAYVDLAHELIPFYVWVRERFGIEAFLKVQEVTPWVFTVVILASTLFPYVYLSCRAVFSREASGPLEAARLLGAGPLRRFFTVAVPMARPAIAGGASLVAMETINDFGVVTAFGLTPLTPGIFRVWGEGHPAVAMRLALLLTGIVLIFVAVERWQRGSRVFAGGDGETPLTPRRHGPVGVAGAWVCCLLPLVPGLLLPAWRLGRWAWHSWELARWEGHLEAMRHSFTLALGSAAAVTAGALVLVAGRRALAGGGLGVAQRIGLLGYTLPSALIAVGVGALASTLSGAPGLSGLALSASVFGLMTAYFVRYLAVAIQPVSAGFAAVSPELHHTARTLGARPLRALATVDLRLARPACFAAATLVFIDVFKELPITLVLRPFDYETLATRIFRLTEEARVPEAAIPGLFLLVISLAGLIPLTRAMRPR